MICGPDTVGAIFRGYHWQFAKSLRVRPYWPRLPRSNTANPMKTLAAKDAKYGFGRLIDLARAEPIAVAKHGRPVVVVLSVEELRG